MLIKLVSMGVMIFIIFLKLEFDIRKNLAFTQR